VKEVVYFIQDGLGNIKIGVSVNVSHRLADLRGANSTELTLLATEPGGYLMEQAMHWEFGEYRIHGEWYSPGVRLMKYIEKAQGKTAEEQQREQFAERRRKIMKLRGIVRPGLMRRAILPMSQEGFRGRVRLEEVRKRFGESIVEELPLVQEMLAERRARAVARKGRVWTLCPLCMKKAESLKFRPDLAAWLCDGCYESGEVL
jgi:hypothetical protein